MIAGSTSACLPLKQVTQLCTLKCSGRHAKMWKPEQVVQPLLRLPNKCSYPPSLRGQYFALISASIQWELRLRCQSVGGVAIEIESVGGADLLNADIQLQQDQMSLCHSCILFIYTINHISTIPCLWNPNHFDSSESALPRLPRCTRSGASRTTQEPSNSQHIWATSMKHFT